MSCGGCDQFQTNDPAMVTSREDDLWKQKKKSKPGKKCRDLVVLIAEDCYGLSL